MGMPSGSFLFSQMKTSVGGSINLRKKHHANRMPVQKDEEPEGGQDEETDPVGAHDRIIALGVCRYGERSCGGIPGGNKPGNL
ncbi:hypothetical protein D3C73_1443990 [compost metagenome]